MPETSSAPSIVIGGAVTKWLRGLKPTLPKCFHDETEYEDYYYGCNWRGDVVAIFDSEGNLAGTYDYDAWGNAIYFGDADGNYTDDSAHITLINPIRYRGYYCDTETGFYYLNSRYYDPLNHRFLNADDTAVLDEDYESMAQYNLYAYCWNNPVNMYDPDGYWTVALAGGSYFVAAGTLGTSNFWNPVGWVVLGTVVVIVGVNVYYSAKSSSDPYARPGQKKQGRERKNKARKSKDWKPRSNPKPPKKHTPGRGHRKYK